MTVTEAAALIDAASTAVHITTGNDLAKALDALGLLADLEYPPVKAEPQQRTPRAPNKSLD